MGCGVNVIKIWVIEIGGVGGNAFKIRMIEIGGGDNNIVNDHLLSTIFGVEPKEFCSGDITKYYYIYIHIYTHTHTEKYSCIGDKFNLSTAQFVHARACTCTHTHMHTYTRTHAYMHVCIYGGLNCTLRFITMMICLYECSIFSRFPPTTPFASPSIHLQQNNF